MRCRDLPLHLRAPEAAASLSDKGVAELAGRCSDTVQPSLTVLLTFAELPFCLQVFCSAGRCFNAALPPADEPDR